MYTNLIKKKVWLSDSESPRNFKIPVIRWAHLVRRYWIWIATKEEICMLKLKMYRRRVERAYAKHVKSIDSRDGMLHILQFNFQRLILFCLSPLPIGFRVYQHSVHTSDWFRNLRLDKMEKKRIKDAEFRRRSSYTRPCTNTWQILWKSTGRIPFH